VELEELGDARAARSVEPQVRFRKVLEPLEVARVRGGRRGEGLGVRRLQGVALPAGLREELGVLLEDLEVLLFICWVLVFLGGCDGYVQGLTMSVTGSPTRSLGGWATCVAGALQRGYPAGAAGSWAWK
jgi:hypothetical protein